MPTLWTPADVSPTLWFDASDGATITLSGSSVSDWQSKGSITTAPTQGGSSARPTLITNELNGLSVVRFDGGDFLTGGEFDVLRNAGSAIMYVVRKFSASPTSTQVMFGMLAGTSGSAVRAGLGGGISSGKPFAGGRRLDANSFQRVDAVTSSPTTWQLHGGVFKWSSAELTQYIDATQDGYSSSFQTSGNTSNTATGRTRIGANTAITAGEFFSGDIAEIVLVENDATTDTRQRVEGYLAHKWGLTANLPAGHPYKLSAPQIFDGLPEWRRSGTIGGHGLNTTAIAGGFNVVGEVLTLTIQSAAHAHAADAANLSSAHTLAVADTTHAQSAEAVTLSTTLILSVNGALHTHGAENITLSAGLQLVVQSAAHAQTVDSVALSAALQLVIDDALHGQTADGIGLTTGISLAIDDASHAHDADNVTLSADMLLAIQSAVHAQSADNVGLSAAMQLAIDGTTHAHSADSVAITSVRLLEIADAAHAHYADGLDLSAAMTLAIQDAGHAQTATTVFLSAQHSLQIADALHLHHADHMIFRVALPLEDFLRFAVTARIARQEAVARIGEAGTSAQISTDIATAQIKDTVH